MEAGVHELTAAYALDALDPEDRRVYEEHLAGCARCQGELAAFLPATEALAVAASGPEPRSELRERILAGARTEPHVVVALVSRRNRAVPVLAAAAAFAAVLALAVGLWGVRISGDLDEARSALERDRAAAAILANPATSTVALQSGRGRLVVAPDGRAVLVLLDFEPAPAGKTYQLWIAEGGDVGRARSAGVFPGRAGTDVNLLDGILTAGDVVAVTVEDAGGVDAPTSDPIAASNPV